MEGVVPFPCGESVIGRRAPHHHVLNSAVADSAVGQAGEQGGFVPGGEGVVKNGSGGAHPARFEVKGGGGKHIPWQVDRRGVA